MAAKTKGKIRAKTSTALFATSARKRFTQIAEALLQRLEVPGLTAAVVFPDDSWFRLGRGLTDVESGAPMLAESRMLGGSTGKSIFAATAVSMALEGRLGLDDHIARWLGDEPWFGRVPNAADITIRSLLTHTAGVPDHMGDPPTLAHFQAMRNTLGNGYYLPPLEAMGRIFDMQPVAAVGGPFFYSDTSYILLGLTLEAVTGRPLYEEARRRVLEPLGLDEFEPAVCRSFANLSPGYVSPSDHLMSIRKTTRPDGRMQLSPASEWAGGGFVTGALSLARFARAYASGRAFGHRSYLNDVQKIVRFSWSPGRITGYGLGLFATATPLGPAWGHAGYFPGYGSNMQYFPDHDLSVAYQVNSSQKVTNYVNIVTSRREATKTAIPADAPLSCVTDPCVELAAAALDIELAA